jgi:hypothetical protein
MAKDTKKQFTDDQLKKFVDDGLTGQDIIKNTEMNAGTLQRRYFNIVGQTGNVKYALKDLNNLSYEAVSNNFGVVVGKKLCQAEGIMPGMKFNIGFTKGKKGEVTKIILTRS